MFFVKLLPRRYTGQAYQIDIAHYDSRYFHKCHDNVERLSIPRERRWVCCMPTRGPFKHFKVRPRSVRAWTTHTNNYGRNVCSVCKTQAWGEIMRTALTKENRQCVSAANMSGNLQFHNSGMVCLACVWSSIVRWISDLPVTIGSVNESRKGEGSTHQ